MFEYESLLDILPRIILFTTVECQTTNHDHCYLVQACELMLSLILYYLSIIRIVLRMENIP